MNHSTHKEQTMKLLDRILVPVDLGPNTVGVIDAATQLAANFDARLRLIYVIEEVPHFPAALELLKQGAEERLARLHDELVARRVPCEPPMTVVGKPFDAIVRHADAANAHLVVMGRGGRGDATHAALGTTTSRVMRRSAKPVLAVAPGQSKPIRRILCPVDGSNPSARGLRNAILLAQGLKARLTVMTAIADLAPLFGAARRPDMAKVASDYQKMEREQFEQFIKGFDFGDVTWDKEVHYGHPADEIVRLATDAEYDLVVMGSTGRSGLPRVLLGSTAETVARRSACSVLTVKREDVLAARLESELGDIKRLLAEGQSLLDQGLYDDAISHFDQCLLKDPYLAVAIEGLAAAHERLGHTELAADLEEQAALIRRELWPQHEPSEAVLG
jgi:nucleotide-binding universal stress UspA family protein